LRRARAAAGDGGVAAGLDAIDRYHHAIDVRLSGREYIAGTFSYADIAFFMAQFFASFLGAPPPTSLAGVAAWRARVGARDSVRKVAGTMADYLRAQGLQLPPL